MAAQLSALAQQKLNEHLQVLIGAGLLTAAQAATIHSFVTLCPKADRTPDERDIFDVITMDILNPEEGDIARLSDGRCYSKQGMIEFLRVAQVDRLTRRPILPSSQHPVTDSDYIVLGLPVPGTTQGMKQMPQQGTKQVAPFAIKEEPDSDDEEPDFDDDEPPMIQVIPRRTKQVAWPIKHVAPMKQVAWPIKQVAQMQPGVKVPHRYATKEIEPDSDDDEPEMRASPVKQVAPRRTKQVAPQRTKAVSIKQLSPLGSDDESD